MQDEGDMIPLTAFTEEPLLETDDTPSVGPSTWRDDDVEDGSDATSSGLLRFFGRFRAPRYAHLDETGGAEDDGLASHVVATGLSTWQVFVFHIRSTLREMRSRKFNFAMGWASVCVVVFSIALLMTIMAHSPIIFTRMAELKAGQRDVVVQARNERINASYALHYARQQDARFGFGSARMRIGVTASRTTQCKRNAHEETQLQRSDDGTPHLLGFVQRVHQLCLRVFRMSGWTSATVGGSVSNASAPRAKAVPSRTIVSSDTWSNVHVTLGPGESMVDLSNLPDGPNKDCDHQSASMSMIWISTANESQAGIGTQWPYEEIPMGGLILHDPVAKRLGVGVGDWINLRATAAFVWGAEWMQSVDQFPAPLNSTRTYLEGDAESMVNFPMKVVDVAPSTYDKVDHDSDKVAFMEYKYMGRWISQFLATNFTAGFREHIVSLPLEEMATELTFNVDPTKRAAVYVDANVQRVRSRILRFASQLSFVLGFNQLFLSAPVVDELEAFTYFSLFIGVILNFVAIFFVAMTSLLVYSLMMVSVDSRTFELGVLRMIGMTRSRVVGLLLTQGVWYAIPGCVIGLIGAGLVNQLIFQYFESITGVTLSSLLSTRAVFTSSLVGLVVPLVASIAPIRSALSGNVHDSIDVKRPKVAAVEYHLDRSDDSAIPVMPLVFGGSLSVFGFLIYYLFPLSLLSTNLVVLLNLFVGLLVAMLGGMVVLSLNVTPFVERGMIWVTLAWWEKAAIVSMVRANLTAHRKRNRKTSVLYALALAFVLFLAVSWASQRNQLWNAERQRGGARLRIDARGRGSSNVAFSVPHAKTLEDIALSDPGVRQVAWITHRLNRAVDRGKSIAVSAETIGRSKSFPLNVYGASANIFQFHGFGDLVEYSGTDSMGVQHLSPVETLYTARGSQSAIMGSVLRRPEKMNLNLGHDFAFTARHGRVTRRQRFRASAFLDIAPAFTFSVYPLGENDDAIVSIPTWIRLMQQLGNTSVGSVTSIPYSSLLIDVKPDISAESLDALARKLHSAAGFQFTYFYDLRNMLSGLEAANQFLGFFFGFSIIVAMAVCFFSLMSSMFTNVMEQQQEIGVLMAIGMRKAHIIRSFVEEAFVVILSACFVGIIVGTLVAYSMVQQQVLFNQLPLPFAFPKVLLLVVSLASVVFALLATYGPAKATTTRSIVAALRGK